MNFRNDSILLIPRPLKPYVNCVCGPYKIYEFVENSGAMRWKLLANFGQPDYEMRFPPIITPMKNEQFIFHPRWTLRNYVHVRNLIDTIEFWNISTTFIRMPLELPFNLTENLAYLWIFKLWLFQKNKRYFYGCFRMILRRDLTDTRECAQKVRDVVVVALKSPLFCEFVPNKRFITKWGP